MSERLMCWYRTKADKCYWCNLDDIFLPITTPHLIVSNKIYLPNVSQGSVSSKRLHWQKIHDLGSAAWNLLLLVFFNVRAFVFTCIVGLGLQDQSHPGVAFKTWKWERNLSFSGSLYVVKEFGLVFAVHQTFLLDHQFCMVESKLLSYSALISSNSHKRQFHAAACALDFTFQFDWWLDRENWINSTTLNS